MGLAAGEAAAKQSAAVASLLREAFAQAVLARQGEVDGLQR